MTNPSFGDQNRKPRIINPKQAKEAEDILSRPPNTAYNHTDLSSAIPSHRESISPSPDMLGPGRGWFLPGLAYCMVGIDRSMFELYSNELGKPVKVVSYLSDNPLFYMRGVESEKNRWFHTIQGIDPELSGNFSDYIQTFEFRSSEMVWRLVCHRVRIADPFVKSDTKSGVDATIMLPVCITGNTRVTILNTPGLKLGNLVLGLEQIPADVQ